MSYLQFTICIYNLYLQFPIYNLLFSIVCKIHRRQIEMEEGKMEKKSRGFQENSEIILRDSYYFTNRLTIPRYSLYHYL